MEIDPSSPADSPARESKLPRFNFTALRQIIFQPGQAFAGIVAQPKKAWLTPVVVVLALIVLAALAASQGSSRNSLAQANARQSANPISAQSTRTSTGSSKTSGSSSSQAQTQGGFAGGPGGAPPVVIFQGDPGGAPAGAVIQIDPGGGPTGPGGFITSPGTTTTGTGASASSANLGLTILSPVINFLLTWLLLGVLTNLLSLGFGGHGNTGMAMNIAAWSSIPIGVRNLMQIFYYLASGNAISSPGLSGFAPTANGNNLLMLVQQILSRVDLYLFWQIGLLAVGVAIWGGLARKKSWPVAILGISLVLILQSLIGLGLELLGNMNLDLSTLLRLR